MIHGEDKTKKLFDNIEKAGILAKEISSTQSNISNFLKNKDKQDTKSRISNKK